MVLRLLILVCALALAVSSVVSIPAFWGNDYRTDTIGDECDPKVWEKFRHYEDNHPEFNCKGWKTCAETMKESHMKYRRTVFVWRVKNWKILAKYEYKSPVRLMRKESRHWDISNKYDPITCKVQYQQYKNRYNKPDPPKNDPDAQEWENYRCAIWYLARLNSELLKDYKQPSFKIDENTDKLIDEGSTACKGSRRRNHDLD